MQEQTKTPFVTLEQLQDIVKEYPTPFHLYDEKGIRQTARESYLCEAVVQAK